jgi:hypothetical protein
MKKRIVFIGIPVALLAITITLLALAPTILSGNRAKNRIVSMVNQHLPGQLQIKEWSLGWFSEIQIDGITYENRDEGLRAKVAEMRSSRNLIRLISAYYKLGNIEVIDPVVYLDLAAEAERPETETEPVSKVPAPPKKDAPVTAGGLPPFSGRLRITNGTLHTVTAQGQNKVIAKDLSLVLDAAGREKPLKFRMLIKSGDGSGHIAGEGSLILSSDDPSNLETALADAMLKVDNWEMAELLELIAARSDLPAGKGRLSADLDLKGKSAESLQVTGNLSIPKLQLWGGPLKSDRPVIEKISVGMEAVKKKDALSLNRLTLRSSLATGTIRGMMAGHRQNQFDATAVIDLAQAFSQMPQTLKLQEGTRLSGGKLNLSARVESTDSGTLFDTDGRIDRLRGVSDGKTLMWNKPVTFKAKGKIDLNSRSVHFAPVEIDLQPGKVRISELIVSDWSDILNTTKARAVAGLDLAKATKAYGDFMPFPEKTRISGNAQIDLDLNFADPATGILLLNADLSPFKMTSAKQPAISEKNVKVAIDLRRNPDGKTYTLKKVQLDSQLLSLSGAGSIIQNRNRITLDLKGSITPNLTQLSGFLPRDDAPKIEIAGHAQRPFHLKMVSSSPRWDNPLGQMNFSGTLFVKSINAFGLYITPGDVPIRVADSVAFVDLDAAANSGRMLLQPTVDLHSDPFVLSLAENTDILKDVRITSAMAETLLTFIHPSFQGTVIPGGELNLFMQHFKWPLDKKRTDKISFGGNLKVNGLRMQAAPMLIPLLAIAGIEGSVVEFDAQNIEFTARNGRIETSPIRMSVEDYRLTLQGSVGFDQTLAYTAQIPVTRRLVGRDGYKYLKGTTIKVPIRGTVSSPEIDEQALEEAAASLVQHALQKVIERKAGDLLEKLFQ